MREDHPGAIVERDLANAEAPGAPPPPQDVHVADHAALALALSAYDIGHELGRGASGIVLAGHHRGLGREVAIKQLPRLFGADPQLRARFLSEARLLSSMDHPHIVRVYDFVETEDVCALVMQRLTGGTVGDRIQQGVLDPRAACAVIVATCAGLHYAHGKGVLHRDIKPQNLMFSDEGVLKVTDFGIARVLGDATTALTHSGQVLGTPAYMAPEQARGQPPGPGVDIYAVGVVLYLLLCGELPFPTATDALTELYQHVHTDPVPLEERDSSAPAALAAVVACALARDPGERYASARELAVAVSQAAAQEWGPRWASGTGVPLLGEMAGSGTTLPPPTPTSTARAPEQTPPDPHHPGAATTAIGASPALAGPTVTDGVALDRGDGEPDLLERDRELQALADALQDALAGQGALVLISGPPGIGKTRLARAAVDQAHGRQMQTLATHADPLDGAIPLGLVRRLFEAAVREALTDDASAVREGGAAAAVDLVLGQPTRTGAPRQARIEAFCRLATNLAQRAPLALIVDDVELADALSLDVLLELVGQLDELSLAIVLTARSQPGAAEELLSRFAGDRFAPHLRPAPLSAHAVGLLLRARWPQADDNFCAACRAASAGNPLLLLDLASDMAAAGLEPNAAPVARMDLDRVAGNVRARLDALPAEAQALAQALAVLGEHATPAQFARAAALDDPAAAAGAVDALAHVAIVRPGAPAAFRHPVARSAIYDALAPNVRSDRHLTAARLLHADGAAPETVAAHLLRTDPAHDTWVAERLNDAAARALSVGAPDMAVAYLERARAEPPAAETHVALSVALAHAHEQADARDKARRVIDDALAATDDPRLQGELLVALGGIEARASEWSAAKDSCRRAAELARRHGDPELLAQAGLAYGLGPGEAQYVAGADATLVALLDEALRTMADEPTVTRARVLGRLAVELHLTDAVERRAALGEQAVAIARELGDPAVEALALYSRLTATWSRDDLPGRLAGADDILRLAGELHDDDMSFRAHRLKLRALLEAGDLAAADGEIAALAAAAGEIGRPWHRWQATLYHAMRALYGGRVDEAEELALAALELGRQVDGDLALRCYDGQASMHRWLVGRRRELIPALREVAESCPWLPARRAALAFGLADAGRSTEALAHFEQLAADEFRSLPDDGNWLLAMTFLGLACALLEDRRRAEPLYAALVPYRDRLALSGDCTTTWGPVSTSLGVLAHLRGEAEIAIDHFEAAIAQALSTGAPAQTVLAQCGYARTLLSRGRPGDGQRAAALLEDALSAARQHGFAALAHQAQSLQAT